MLGSSMISASAQGMDQSIDTVDMRQYDYYEDVRPSSQI